MKRTDSETLLLSEEMLTQETNPLSRTKKVKENRALYLFPVSHV